jgi:uncharacterized membrane protein YebE (DUF533 family)
MNKSIIAMFTGLLVLTPLAAQAGQIQNRIDHQQQRTYQGVKHGSISPQEFRKIERREDNIEAARIRAARSGGKLTQAEKNRLNHRLNKLSHTIYHDKHN